MEALAVRRFGATWTLFRPVTGFTFTAIHTGPSMALRRAMVIITQKHISKKQDRDIPYTSHCNEAQ